MKKENIYTAKEKTVDKNYFTGNVLIREVFGQSNSAEQEMYHVTFQNGALTTLHCHESDQILIATKGKGVVGLITGTMVTKFKIDDIDITFLEKDGDAVCIPANKIHFHGAASKEEFSHIAIRKMYKVNGIKGEITKAENRWEYDLISEETGIRDPGMIKKRGKELAKKIEKAIDKSRNARP